MAAKLYALAIYFVRASGLVIVGFMAAALIASPVIGKPPSWLASFGGMWLMASVALSWPSLPDAWRKDPPTQRQLEYAASLGIDVPDGVSKGQLSDMISRAAGR